MPDPAVEGNVRRARWAAEIRSRLASLNLPPAHEAGIVDELCDDLEDRYHEAIAGGADPESAVRLALAGFHDAGTLAEEMKPLRHTHAAGVTPGAPGARWPVSLWQDLRYAARALRRRPAFALTATLTLALGIGATTAIFSVVYGVLLRPLPFADPESLVTVNHRAPRGGTNHGPATYLTYRENQTAFEAIGAWDTKEATLTGGVNPERVEALAVTASTLRLLRVQPVLGHGFSTADDGPGAPSRVMLTYGYWQRRFAGAPDVIGTSLIVNGEPHEVIGVLPAAFRFLRTRPEVLLPLPLDPDAPRTLSFDFQVVGRLKPGLGLAQANADLGRMIGLLPPGFASLELSPDVKPLAEAMIGNVRDILWILLAAVGIVWLIACGNVANLFLVRADVRYPELATRMALGAGRGRLAQVLLSESLLLAVCGGLAGTVFAVGATRLLRAIAPANLPRVDDIAVDGTVLLFMLGVSVLSGAVFGVIAVLRFWNPDLTMKEETRTSASPARHRTRNALVVVQMALALTLLVVSGLMVRTFVAMRQVAPGFTDPAAIQTFVVAIPDGVISNPQEAARAFEAIAGELARLPGVSSVGLSTSITMDGENNGNSIQVEGAEAGPNRRFKSVAPGYFETMGNPMVAGRALSWDDIHAERRVVVVSDTLAKQVWGSPAMAIGRRLRRTQGPGTWYEVIGVSGEERDDGLTRPATAIVYWPLLNDAYRWRTMAFAVRSSRAGTAAFTRELEQAVWSVNRTLPLANAQTVAEIQARSMAQTSFALVMLSLAAGVALLIGAVGIYGVMAYAATQRTREIGVRMALGARAADVQALFVRHGLWLTSGGIAIGIGLALLSTRAMSSFLFGIEPTDPATYAAVSGALAAIALVATYLPAWRASRVDPIAALRTSL